MQDSLLCKSLGTLGGLAWHPRTQGASGKLLMAPPGVGVCRRKQKGQGTLGMLERVVGEDRQTPEASL